MVTVSTTGNGKVTLTEHNTTMKNSKFPLVTLPRVQLTSHLYLGVEVLLLRGGRGLHGLLVRPQLLPSRVALSYGFLQLIRQQVYSRVMVGDPVFDRCLHFQHGRLRLLHLQMQYYCITISITINIIISIRVHLYEPTQLFSILVTEHEVSC